MASPPQEPSESQEPHEPLTSEAPPSSFAGACGLPDAAKELASQLEELTRRLAALAETVRREHERAAHREQVIDRLHAENQQLRHGVLQEALTPVRAGLYRLYDTAAREAARWHGPSAPSVELAGHLLAAMADEVAEVLGRTGAERVSVRPGDAYDPVVHRPARTSTVETGADGTVIAVLAEGFAMGDRVLRKASVIVGRAGSEPEKPKSGKERDSQIRSKEQKDRKQQKNRKDYRDHTPGDGTSDAVPHPAGGGTDKGSE